jgi:hypothetical protein
MKNVFTTVGIVVFIFWVLGSLGIGHFAFVYQAHKIEIGCKP